jgi:hypothetical protein
MKREFYHPTIIHIMFQEAYHFLTFPNLEGLHTLLAKQLLILNRSEMLKSAPRNTTIWGTKACSRELPIRGKGLRPQYDWTDIEMALCLGIYSA